MCLPSPKIPKPPSIPRPPTPLSEGVLNAREKERAAAQAASGHQSTIRTSSRGVTDSMVGGSIPQGPVTPSSNASQPLGGNGTILGEEDISTTLARLKGKKRKAGSGGYGGGAGSLVGGALFGGGGGSVSGATRFAV